MFNHCFSLECCGHIVWTKTFFQMQESPHERMFFVISRDMGCSCLCTVWVHLLEFLRYTSIVNHGRVKLKIYLRMDWREGHNFRNVWWTLVYNFRYYKKYDFFFLYVFGNLHKKIFDSSVLMRIFGDRVSFVVKKMWFAVSSS